MISDIIILHCRLNNIVKDLLIYHSLEIWSIKDAFRKLCRISRSNLDYLKPFWSSPNKFETIRSQDLFVCTRRMAVNGNIFIIQITKLKNIWKNYHWIRVVYSRCIAYVVSLSRAMCVTEERHKNAQWY
jgi:hypothetical protein